MDNWKWTDFAWNPSCDNENFKMKWEISRIPKEFWFLLVYRDKWCRGGAPGRVVAQPVVQEWEMMFLFEAMAGMLRSSNKCASKIFEVCGSGREFQLCSPVISSFCCNPLGAREKDVSCVSHGIVVPKTYVKYMMMMCKIRHMGTSQCLNLAGVYVTTEEYKLFQWNGMVQ